MSDKERLYVLVPDGSTLEWTLTSESKDYIASAEMAVNGTSFKRWEHLELADKTVRFSPLERPKRYILLVQVAFTGTEKVDVKLKAQVLRPNNSTHSKPWSTTLSGKKPAVDQAVITVITKK